MDTADAKFWVNLPPRLVCGPQKLLRTFGGKILCLHRHDCAIRGEEGIRLISAQSYWRFTLSKYWLSIFSLFVAFTREPSKPDKLMLAGMRVTPSSWERIPSYGSIFCSSMTFSMMWERVLPIP